MKSESEIRNCLAALMIERREQGAAVTIDINAALALMQLIVESEISILKWVLHDDNKS